MTASNTTRLMLTGRYSPEYAQHELGEGAIVDAHWFIPSTNCLRNWHGVTSQYRKVEHEAGVSFAVCGGKVNKQDVIVFGGMVSAPVIAADDRQVMTLPIPQQPPSLYVALFMQAVVEYLDLFNVSEEPDVLIIGSNVYANMFSQAVVNLLDVECSQLTSGITLPPPEIVGLYDIVIDCRLSAGYTSCAQYLRCGGVYYGLDFGNLDATRIDKAGAHYIVENVSILDAKFLNHVLREVRIPVVADDFITITETNFGNVFPALSCDDIGILKV